MVFSFFYIITFTAQNCILLMKPIINSILETILNYISICEFLWKNKSQFLYLILEIIVLLILLPAQELFFTLQV